MKQTKINRGLNLVGLALRVTTLDDETRLEITTRRAFKNDDLAHGGWSWFAFVVYSCLLSGSLLLPGWTGAFDDYGFVEQSAMIWYAFIWVLWQQMMKD